MIIDPAADSKNVPEKRPRINLYVKQKLIEELLELPYAGKDLRTLPFGSDTNYLGQFIRRKPDRRRDELIRESRKKMEQEKPFARPEEFPRCPLHSSGVLDDFLAEDAKAKLAAQAQQEKQAAHPPRALQPFIRKQPVKTFRKFEKGLPSTEGQTYNVELFEPSIAPKPSGSIRKLIDLTQLKKGDRSVRKEAQPQTKYNELFEETEKKMQQPPRIITERTQQESPEHHQNPTHDKSETQSMPSRKLPQVSNVDISSEARSEPSESKHIPQEPQFPSKSIPQRPLVKLPSEVKLTEEQKQEAEIINEELRGVLTKNKESHTPSNSVSGEGVSAAEDSQPKETPIVEVSQPSIEDAQHSQDSQIQAHTDEVPELQKAHPSEASPSESNEGVDWHTLPNFDEEQEPQVVDFAELPDYQTEPEEWPAPIDPEEPHPSPGKSSSASKEPQTVGLEGFEAYQSSEDLQPVAKKELEEVKEAGDNESDDSQGRSVVHSFLKKNQPSDQLENLSLYLHPQKQSLSDKRQTEGQKQEKLPIKPPPENPSEPQKPKSNQSMNNKKQHSNSFFDKLSEQHLSSIPSAENHDEPEEESPIDIEHMMVQDAKQDVNELYQRMSAGMGQPGKPRSNNGMAQLFEGLNEQLNMSELRKEIDKLKQKIAGDHSGLL